MKLEYLAVAIVALAAATCAGPTHSPPAAENRYRKTGNRADKATDLKLGNTAASTTASKNVPVPNGETADRTKNAMAPWDLEHTEIQSQTYTSISVWKPPIYSLSRPYFIPIYGSSGRIPIYFAPQPYEGRDKPPFTGPAYLPPKEYPQTETPPAVTVKDRFEFDDDDDRPVWNQGTNNDINDKETEKTIRPPVHLSAEDENIMNAIFKMTPTTQTTRKPARPRPTPSRTTTTTTTTPAPGTPGPSNCVWAVVSCCSASTNVYPEKCFEQRGCPGPFWGSSPCDTEFAKAAVEAALKYYNP